MFLTDTVIWNLSLKSSLWNGKGQAVHGLLVSINTLSSYCLKLFLIVIIFLFILNVLDKHANTW